MGYCGVYPGERVTMLKGFHCSIGIALSLLIATAGGDQIIVETSHASIEAQEEQRLRVVFAAEDRPALIFRPEAGAWDWSRTSRLIIPVDNPGDEALTLLLQVEDHMSRSLTGEVGIAPRTAGNLDRCAAAAVDGHDRGTFAGTSGPRTGYIAGHGDRRRNRCLGSYAGSPWDAASIDPPNFARRAAAGRAGSHLLRRHCRRLRPVPSG
jgi:hypothetical protein